MAPGKVLSEIKLEDIDFDGIQECTDAKVLKRYLKLLEDDGNYFVDLIRACKDKLLEVAPKEYYLLYPRSTTPQEEQEAMQDILDWELSVKETDAALRKAKKESIWEDAKPQAQWQVSTVDGQNRKVLSSEPRRVREGAEDVWEDAGGAQVGSDLVTNINEVPEAHKKHMADSEKEKGNEAFYSKDFQEAEAYYSRSLQYMADDPSTWANRALVRLKLEQAEGALEDCEHALALNPEHVKAWHRKGKALYELQRYQEAVKAFQEGLLLSPGNTQINGDLMVARRKLRDDETVPRPNGEANGKGPKQLADAPSIASVPLQSGYTRVQIEEDSESEEEQPLEKKGSGFKKIAIEEVSGSEDEAAPDPPDRFNPPPRTRAEPPAPAVVGPVAGGFDDMD